MTSNKFVVISTKKFRVSRSSKTPVLKLTRDSYRISLSPVGVKGSCCRSSPQTLEQVSHKGGEATRP